MQTSRLSDEEFQRKDAKTQRRKGRKDFLWLNRIDAETPLLKVSSQQDRSNP
jgi:hypothetical protein